MEAHRLAPEPPVANKELHHRWKYNHECATLLQGHVDRCVAPIVAAPLHTR
jgi:hypothetical protein